MPLDDVPDLRPVFEGKEIKAPDTPGEVPERIRTDKLAPVLKPGGSWTSAAAAVDQAARERADAEKAKREWAADTKTGWTTGTGAGQKSSMRHSFRRSAKW